MSEHMSPIPSRIYNAAVNGHVCGPEDVDFGQKVVHLIKYDKSGNEVSFESQVTQANKIYVIHDDFVLNSNVTIPANCVLEFDGGSIKNATGNTYKVTGTKTKINTSAEYNIFDNTLGGGFELPYIDLRWIGGISDYDEVNEIGTDNADAFERAINLIGQYYNGCYINIVGQFYVGSTITTTYDLNLKGYHNNSRDLLNSGSSTPSSPSLIAIASNCSFELVGRSGSSSAKFCNFSIHNIKVIGIGEHPSFIKYSASGAPSRISIVEECEFTELEYCIFVYGNYEDTMLGDLTISKCLAYSCGKVLYASSDSSSHRTLCNCIIKDCNLEQGGANCIYIKHSFSSVIINNNILEGQPSPIHIEDYTGSVTISNNYFEANTGTVIYAKGRNSECVLNLKDNYLNQNIIIEVYTIRLYGNLSRIADGSIIAGCWIEDFDNFKVSWIPELEYGTSVRFSKFSLGAGNTNLRTHKKNGLLGTEINSSFTSRTGFNLTGNVGICAFYATTGGNIGFYKSGSGRQGSFSADNGNLVIFKQNLLYGDGYYNIYMSSANNAFISGITMITNNTKVHEILIPPSELVLAGSTRPSLNDMQVGYSFFDESLSPARIIYYKGNNVWVDATGTTV